MKILRILLWPFSQLYRLGISVYNFCFDRKIFQTNHFGLPLICVGNLSVGGTGKSPMVEYLVNMLQPHYKIATLSRGYKRKTSGYALANEKSTALDIGDEPMQFHLKFPDLPVAVGEKRVEAVAQLLQDRPATAVIILDDAFQHRAIQAGLNILLTDINNLFTKDHYLPYGTLRDLKSSYKRADIIVVTKCDAALNDSTKKKIIAEIKPLPHQKVFFTKIDYGQLYHILTQKTTRITPATNIVLVTGIANTNALQAMFKKHTEHFQIMKYSDHHIYTIDDFQQIKKTFDAIHAENKIIITTEKDAVRLIKFRKEISALPIYVLPMQHEFLFGDADIFQKNIIDYITQKQLKQ